MIIIKRNQTVCERCLTIQEGHKRSCFCGNPYLMNLYADDNANRKELKDLLKNKANNKKFMFRCPTCESEVSFYTATPSQASCLSCGDLMIRYIDLEECQDLIVFCMNELHLTQAQLGIKLKTTRQVIANVLRGTANLNIEQYKLLDKLYAVASCAKSA